MTLIIAFILMAHVGAFWLWYPVVFIVWLLHLAANDSIKVRRK